MVVSRDGVASTPLLPAFEKAIGCGELRVYFQALFNSHTQRVCGAEALVRWQHPSRGLLSPAAFLSEIECSPLIVPMTDWVLDEALRWCALWRGAGNVVPVSVNLSATLLGDTALVSKIAAALVRAEVPAHLLTLEVTESALIEQAQSSVNILAELRALGLRLSLDDFGTGYTSLAMLKKFRFDEIKIDASFVGDALTLPEDNAIVRAILELGHRLGLEVVAEGVEDAATATFLAKIGCDVLQGFHFARPIPADDFDAVLGPKVSPITESIHREVISDGPSAGAVRAALPANEAERLAALEEMEILDTAPEEAFDDIVEIAAAVLGVPIALLSLVDRDRQWFKARHGANASETARDIAFCAHAILLDDVLEVPDARGDARFRTNPFVTEDPHIRFYAGAPLTTAEGHNLGTLCVLDSVPRTLTDLQKDLLQRLSRQAVRQMESRRSDLLLERLENVLVLLTELHRCDSAASAADAVVHATRNLLGAAGASLMLADAPGAVTFRAFGAAATSESDIADLTHLVFDIRDDGAVGAVVGTREPVFVPDASQSQLIDPTLVTRFSIGSALYLPIVTESDVVGTILAWWPESQPTLAPSSRDAAVLLASEAGTTLSRLKAMAELRHVAETDQLTGLANRRAFFSQIATLPPTSAVIMIDLDHFKAVNDLGGHQAGDYALRTFSAHLRAAIRAGDTAGRWGGEEFAVALPSADLEGGHAMLERLRGSWSMCPSVPTTFSAGLVILRAGESPEQALRRADAALYLAKIEGRDRDVVGV
jgi:diguanylate cyclase